MTSSCARARSVDPDATESTRCILHVQYLLAICENHNFVKQIMNEEYRDEYLCPSTMLLLH